MDIIVFVDRTTIMIIGPSTSRFAITVIIQSGDEKNKLRFCATRINLLNF